MALSQNTEIQTTTFNDVDLNSTAETLVVAAAGNKDFFAVTIDNRDNTAKSYGKMWNSISSPPSVGTSVPDFVIPIEASAERTVVANAHSGVTMLCTTNGLYVAGLITAGTGGSTGPTNDMKATFFTS